MRETLPKEGDRDAMASHPRSCPVSHPSILYVCCAAYRHTYIHLILDGEKVDKVMKNYTKYRKETR